MNRLPANPAHAEESVSPPDLWLYRDRMVAMLRRYFRLSLELGRLPSIPGGELFRAHVSSYRLHTFEDVVIFVHDVERCLQSLDRMEQALIARVVLQEYSQAEAAGLLGCTRRTVVRRLPLALDALSRIFLEKGLLRPWVADTAERQEAESAQAAITACGQSK